MKYKKALDTFNLFAPVALQTGRVNFDELLRSTCNDLDLDADRFLVMKDQNEPPQDAHDEEVLMGSGGTAHVGINDNHQDHIRLHSLGMQNVRDDQNGGATSFT